MNVILLSGGSGKRLWPLSNEIRSKQFLKLFQDDRGEYESMVQRMYTALKGIGEDVHITIATSETQVSALHNQLGKNMSLSLEPCRRDTFPAIVLASAYLRDELHVPEDEVIVVCPVDPYVNMDYFEAILNLQKYESSGLSNANLALLGMEPTYPSEKYGYIIPASDDEVSRVQEFKEKPDEKTAEIYIKQGALWNGGVFAYRIKYVMEKAWEYFEYATYQELLEHYEELPKISFDYAVVEREDKIDVMRFSGEWKDLGTWNTLTEAMEMSCIGDVRSDNECENLHVINELDIPVLCMGLKNMVVAASPDGVLIADKEQSSYIKPYVEEIRQKIRYEEKSWGSFRILDAEEHGLTIKVILKEGNGMNYHSHQYRDEVWMVLQGKGIAVVDGVEKEITAGDVVHLPIGCRHTVIATTELHIIEVQSGKNLCVEDKQLHER